MVDLKEKIKRHYPNNFMTLEVRKGIQENFSILSKTETLLMAKISSCPYS